MTNSLQARRRAPAGVPNPFKEVIANILRLQLALYVTQVLALYVTQVSGHTTGHSTDDAIDNHRRVS